MIKRLQHRLDNVLRRLHILDGLLVAYLNIDEVIRIIRTEDRPKPVLMTTFGLSDTQAEAVLNLRLRRLAKLEEINIRAEQKSLAKERDSLEKILASSTRLKTLIRKELSADAQAYGDDRQSPIVERESAQAMTDAEIIPVEPVTVVLSRKGWIRVAKGHDVDPANLSYKAGDRLRAVARGRNNQPVVLLGSTGRSYMLPVHGLPSARGQGEPLTGRLTPPVGAEFLSIIMGDPGEWLLLASTAGYGFVCRLEDLFTKNRNGKVILNLPAASEPLTPIPVQAPDTDLLAAVTREGRILVFPVSGLPTLAKGKGNKIIQIPPKHVAAEKDFLIHLAVLPPGDHLVVHAGKRYLTLKPGNLDQYRGERGRRGRKLPRGFQNVTRLEVVSSAQMNLL